MHRHRYALTLLASVSIILLSQAAFAAETAPGDACTAGEEDHIRMTGGPENVGVRQTLRCNGTIWEELVGSSSVLWERSGTVVRTKSPVDMATDDFVFGAAQLDNGAGTDDDKRMLYNKAKGAFRAGRSATTSWNNASLGNYSAAFGENTQASGIASMAWGESSVASGTRSTAFGSVATASASQAVAFGTSTTASSSNSTAFGTETQAAANHSLAIGLGDSSAATSATYPKVSGAGSFGIFMGDQAGVDVSTANVMAIMGGKVGIGTDAPGLPLHVNGSAVFGSASADNATHTTISPAGAYFHVLGGNYGLYMRQVSNGWFTLDRSGVNWAGILINGSANPANSAHLAIRQNASGTKNIQEWQSSAGTALAVVDPSGKVGIGITNPAEKLVVNGSVRTANDVSAQLFLGRQNNSNSGARINWAGAGSYAHWITDLIYNNFRLVSSTASNNQVEIWNSSTGKTGLYVQGKTGIGTNTPAVELDVVGDIQYTGTLADMSDRRMKEQIRPLGRQLEAIAALQPVSFVMKGSRETELGLIAQDVETIYPELVKASDEGTKSLNYIGLIAPMIGAIRELDQRCSAGAGGAEIEAMRAENRSLSERLDRLERQMRERSRPYND